MKSVSRFWQPVRDFWRTGKTGVLLFLVSLFVLIYGKMALDYELQRGWTGHASVQNVVKDISSFIPVGGAIAAIIVGGIDFLMLLSDWYLARQEKRIQVAKAEGIAEGKAEGIAEGKAEGIAEGKAEGIAEGIAEGKAEAYQEIAAWNARRLAAEAKGIPFEEPPPSQNNNGTPPAK